MPCWSASACARVCALQKVEEVKGGVQITELYTVEIEGETKPGCVAEAIMRLYV
jgi:acyl dehydratase